MSPDEAVLSRPFALQLARRVVLHGARSPFSSLTILASLRDDKTRTYFRAGLAVQLGENLIHDSLADLHAQVFFEWLMMPLENQKAAVEQHFATAPQMRGVSASSFRQCIPDSSELPERQLFEADLSIILTLIKAGACDPRAATTRTCCYMAFVMQRVKTSDGDVRLSLGELAEAVGISPNRLGRVFHRQSGVTFRKYLHAARMFRALTFVKSSDVTLKQGAAMLGYSDSSNLCRDFNKAFGKSAVSCRGEAISAG